MADNLQQKTINEMDSAVHLLAGQVPQPQLVKFKDSSVFRHVEKMPEQAAVQKLSRIVTGLTAAAMLCESGLFQEQAAIQRMIDELGEDVVFLCLPLITGNSTELHKRYLDIFYQEDFDSTTGEPLEDSKQMIPRKNIRAYVAQNGGVDPSGHIKAGKTVHRTDSGYVHAASPYIMDSYGGSPPRFHTRGMLGTPRETEYRWYLKNYFFRSSFSFAIAAKAFKQEQSYKTMMSLMENWQKELENHRW